MSSPVTIEQLPSNINIPQLDPNSSNWAIFKGHFCEAMWATQHWSHFDGTSVCPSYKVSKKPTDNELKEILHWENNDVACCYLLSQCLPNSVTLCLYALDTAKSAGTNLSRSSLPKVSTCRMTSNRPSLICSAPRAQMFESS